MSSGQRSIAIWKYGERVEQICDFSQGLDARTALGNMLAPSVSEPNFYHALIVTLTRMQTQNGRKALLLISSGVDTFSKGNYEDALQAARHSGAPIYAINLAAAAGSAMSSSTGPYSGIDCKRAASDADANPARTVRIELVDSRTRTCEDRRRQSAHGTLGACNENDGQVTQDDHQLGEYLSP